MLQQWQAQKPTTGSCGLCHTPLRQLNKTGILYRRGHWDTGSEAGMCYKWRVITFTYLICACQSMEVGGQLMRVYPFLPPHGWKQIQDIRLGGKCHFWLNHLAGPCDLIFNKTKNILSRKTKQNRFSQEQGIVTHTCNLSTWGTEPGGYPQVKSHP